MGRYAQVLVGYDGTKESELAIRWAVEEARKRRLDLTVCHAWRWPYPISYIDYEGVAIVKRMGRHLLQHGVELAESLAPGLKVHQRLVDGPAVPALLHEGAEGIIVLGSHEREELPVGSSALQVPAHARGPVLVVRAPGTPTDGRVVVGVDDSPGSQAALEFAFEEAALRGWQVEAVSGCWEPGGVAGTEIALFADREKLEQVCGARLQRAVAPWLVKYPQVATRTSLVLEEPRRALLGAAKGADMVVVGARGERGPNLQPLGATAMAMLQMAPCTVAVVHP
ncbi:universal stress protein [Thermomonospora sp. CIF 1]|uniref:universal stress protein n=1 Tax=Thermomonospora sp. CIF 1 TaxID=1916083 RepID=UPI000AC7B35C|nr:universal stress protein [Thermomonospora sp. CIF 1]PKK13250.1 MAG: universal stress protein UspA [Thermomonospora sp. CIF 1]